jgi:hypothetical protein
VPGPIADGDRDAGRAAPGSSALHNRANASGGQRRAFRRGCDFSFRQLVCRRPDTCFGYRTHRYRPWSTLSESPKLERAAAAVGTIAFPLPPARGGRSPWRHSDRVASRRSFGSTGAIPMSPTRTHTVERRRSRSDRAAAASRTIPPRHAWSWRNTDRPLRMPRGCAISPCEVRIVTGLAEPPTTSRQSEPNGSL